MLLVLCKRLLFFSRSKMLKRPKINEVFASNTAFSYDELQVCRFLNKYRSGLFLLSVDKQRAQLTKMAVLRVRLTTKERVLFGRNG